MGRCPHNRAGGQKRKLSHKSARRTKFLRKGEDIIYDELKAAAKSGSGAAKEKLFDEDLPGLGRYYCLHCDRHFDKETTLQEHVKTKLHKKKVKVMKGPKPHSQLDADAAGGMGPPDNGPRLRAEAIPVTMAS